MRNRKQERDLSEIYRGLGYSREDDTWVGHFLHLADQAMFGRRQPPKVVIVERDWSHGHDRTEPATVLTHHRKRAA